MSKLRSPNGLTYIIAGILLLSMFLMAIFSILEDSFTFDETAHVSAGYSYLTQKDMRLNPEHPPLIKDLAAIPLLFLNLNFPKDDSAWIQDEKPVWWHQFDFAYQFLYRSGNDPDQILFWSRLPMILLLIFLGWFIFLWTRKLFGNKAALLSLFLFVFSPNFLAHGRLVTTDVAAAAGAVLGIYYFLKFLKTPTYKNIILAGIAFAIAQLLKFSLILLFPLFIIIFFLWIIFKVERGKIKQFFSYGVKTILVFIIAFLLIWPVYQYHVLNLPTEKIEGYAQEFLKDHPLNNILPKLPLKLGTPAEIVGWMAERPILKPWSHYFLGVFMATGRAAGGNTTYFLGEISASGWIQYFPIVYIIKEPLAFHILTLIALLFFAYSIKRPFWRQTLSRLKNWIKAHFTEFVFLIWLLIYWGTSLSSNLNIGVRHLLPAFPFVYILVGGGIIVLLKTEKNRLFKLIKYSILIMLILWQAVSVIKIYPHFLSYFNETVGGPNNGHTYTVDSNLDWGQDLKRLKTWVEKEGINEIYVDYFGGGDTTYYLGKKFRPWRGNWDPKKLPKESYLAVSVTLLQGGKGQPVHGFDQPVGYYLWLDKYKPIKKIGYSIFVYYID